MSHVHKYGWNTWIPSPSSVLPRLSSATPVKEPDRRCAPRFAVCLPVLCVRQREKEADRARERERERLMGGLIKSSAGNLPPSDLLPYMGTVACARGEPGGECYGHYSELQYTCTEFCV